MVWYLDFFVIYLVSLNITSIDTFTKEIMTATVDISDKLMEEFSSALKNLGYTSRINQNGFSRTFIKEDGTLNSMVKAHHDKGKIKVVFQVFNDVQKLIEYRWKIGSTHKSRQVQYIIAKSTPILISFPVDEGGKQELGTVVKDELWHLFRTEQSIHIEPKSHIGFNYHVNMDELISIFESFTGETITPQDRVKMDDLIRNLDSASVNGPNDSWQYSFDDDAIIEFFAQAMEPVYTAEDEYFIIVRGWTDCRNYASK